LIYAHWYCTADYLSGQITSVTPLVTGPDYVVLHQKNIEAVCSTEAEVREQIRLTVIHEFGHYFGMDEKQLKNV
jgi:predicted Zn-dependent protease with MMP-like domain